jgi:hypothetical protein
MPSILVKLNKTTGSYNYLWSLPDSTVNVKLCQVSSWGWGCCCPSFYPSWRRSALSIQASCSFTVWAQMRLFSRWLFIASKSSTVSALKNYPQGLSFGHWPKLQLYADISYLDEWKNTLINKICYFSTKNCLPLNK